MLSKTANTDHEPAPPPMAQYPVELRDEAGKTVIWRGTTLPCTGHVIPSAIKHDGDVYARTSGVTGGGSVPTRTIFVRAVPAIFIRDQEG